jgi:hemerythrin
MIARVRFEVAEVSMAFMTWSTDMSVGVALFDNEHKRLVDMINELYEGILAGSAKLTLNRVLGELIGHTNVHFSHEEQFFEEAQYPLAAEHKARHEELRQQVFKYREEIDSKNSTLLALELLRYLKEWLAQHILEEDMKYGVFLRTKGVK